MMYNAARADLAVSSESLPQQGCRASFLLRPLAERLSMEGWIKLNRSIDDHWLWKDEPFTKAQAWIDLLLHANYSENKVIIKGQLIQLQKGQQCRSQVTLAEKWRWSRNKVKRFLDLLEKDKMISQQTNQLTSIITICNYSSFQESKQAGEAAGKAASGQQAGSRRSTVEEVKEKKNIGRFTPPTLTELSQYFKEKGINNQSEPQRFIDFYESKGWMVGKNKMKNWKSAASGWISRMERDKPKSEFAKVMR